MHIGSQHQEHRIVTCKLTLTMLYEESSSVFKWMQEHVDHITMLEKEKERRRAESAVVSSIISKLLYPYLPRDLFCGYRFSAGADREIKNKTMAIKTPRGTAWWLVSSQLISSAVKPLAALPESVGPRFTGVNAQLLFQRLIYY